MNPKRIAMISYHTCPLASYEGKETGGMNVYVLELSKALAKRGHIVDMFTRSQDTRNPHLVQVAPRLRVIHLVAGPQQPIAKKKLLPHIPEFVANYQAFTEQENITYDLLHCHYFMSGLAGLEIQKSLPKKLPLIMYFHTLALLKNLVARTLNEEEKSARVEAEFLLADNAQKIISPSENEVEYLQYLYNVSREKIVVISPGIDISRFKPIDKHQAKAVIGANDAHKLILFVGRIEPLKGIDMLLYAMKILISKNPALTICLWIVGGDVSQKSFLWSKELQKLERLRKLLGIPTVVRFVGQKKQEELPYYYNAAEVVVMPSHYESFGMVALEAMACGVPVITTNVAGVSRLIDEKHKALVTSVNNPLLLASQMERLLTDEHYHKQVSDEVFTRVQDLRWENVAKKVEEVYAEVIQEMV